MDALMDPGVNALAGLSQGFAQAAMPTRMPTPMGAALGMGAAGMMAGARNAQQMQRAQQEYQLGGIQNQIAQSAMPMTLAKNKMLGDMWSNPDMMQSIMGAPATNGGATTAAPVQSAPLPAPASTDDVIKNAMASLPDDATRKMATNAILASNIPKEAIPGWLATVHNESGWNLNAPDNVNRNGTTDSGPGQINSATATGMGMTPDQVRDPLTNLTTSAKIYAQNFAKSGGNAGAAMAGYHTGSVANPDPAYVGKGMGTVAGWGAVTPENAGAIADQYEQRAALLDQQQAKAKFWQAQGMPVMAPPGDPAALRTAAQQYRAMALAGPTAGAQENAKAAVQLQTAGGIAAATAAGELPAKLMQQGFMLGPDGKTLVPVPGGQADPKYVGQKAAGEAYAKVAPALMEKGFQLGANGTITPISGGPADPAYVGKSEGAKAQAEADASRTRLITTRAGVFDPVSGKEVYRQPEYHELQDPNTGAEYPAFVAPNDVGGLAVTGGPPGMNGALPPSKLGPGQEDTIKHLADQYAKEDKQKYEGATNSLFQLEQQDKNIAALNANGGWSSTGSGANAKMEWAKAINSGFQTLGMTPPMDPTKVASWEDATKIQTQLAFAQAKQLGSREAQQVISMARAATPGAENTSQGYRAISSGYHEMNNREVDLYNYKTAWLQAHGGNLTGAETAFNNQFTPQMYAERATSTIVPVKITATDQAGAMAQMSKYLPGTLITLPNGKTSMVPPRQGVVPIPGYLQNYLQGGPNAP